MHMYELLSVIYVAACSNYSACWIIQPASSVYRVEITTDEFDLESHSSCGWDSLTIGCRQSELKTAQYIAVLLVS